MLPLDVYVPHSWQVKGNNVTSLQKLLIVITEHRITIVLRLYAVTLPSQGCDKPASGEPAVFNSERVLNL